MRPRLFALAKRQRMVGWALTIRDLDVVDLAIGLHNPQGIGYRVGDNRRYESDKRKAEQPHNQRVSRRFRDIFG